MRGLSTVADAVVFLLLVSAAAVTVTVPGDGTVPPGADGRAELLATTTLTVEYRLDGSGRDGVDRVAHGTAAALVARAAVANARIDGRRISRSGTRFARAVQQRLAERLDPGTHLRARWVPYEGAPIRGSVAVGSRPPPTADVTAAVVTVPVGPAAGRDAGSATYRSLAGSLARATTDRFLPATGAAVPTVGSTVRTDIRRRYRRLAGRDGPVEQFRGGNVSGATAATRRSLQRRLLGDIRREFDGPRTAARELESRTVTITVRRWER